MMTTLKKLPDVFLKQLLHPLSNYRGPAEHQVGSKLSQI